MNSQFSALVFGPGLPPGGAQGALSISTLGLEVSISEHTQRAALNELTLREVGFGKPGIELAWTDNGEAWAAHVLDHEAAQRLLASPTLVNTTQAQALVSKRRRNNTGRTIGWSVMAVFVLLPMILLVALLLNANAIAGWIVDRIPVEQEMEWGRQAFAGMRGSLKLRETGADVDAVKTIGARLSKGSQYKYEFYIADDKTLNAFALPGGVIVIHTGLINATKRPEELAGVIAHEIQHVELRHSMRGMVKNLGLRGAWAAATGDLGGTLIGEAALQLTSLKFSRDDEGEADGKGFDSLLAANIDPAGMPAFFKIMSEQAGDAPAAFISTHPLSEDRERELQKRVTDLPPREFSALNFGLWPPGAASPDTGPVPQSIER
jgi:Zn-dependent protease with chaperone function